MKSSSGVINTPMESNENFLSFERCKNELNKELSLTLNINVVLFKIFVGEKSCRIPFDRVQLMAVHLSGRDTMIG